MCLGLKKTPVKDIYIEYLLPEAGKATRWNKTCQNLGRWGTPVRNPLQPPGRCVLGQDTSAEFAPVGIVHSTCMISMCTCKAPR